jgi:RNA polymerase sigma-70 factor (sigma-E family)
VARISEEQFADFVTARSGMLLRSGYLLTGDHGLAEDLVQTSLEKTYGALGRVSDERALESYTRKIMVNTVISWSRRKSWRNEHPTEAENMPPPDVVSSADGEADDRAAVWAALAQLPPKQRAVMVLRYYEDLTEADTARALGCSVGTVKSHAHRAIARLGDLLGEHAPTATTTTTATNPARGEEA